MAMDGMFLYLWILVLEQIMVASSSVFQDFDFFILNPTNLVWDKPCRHLS